ncbi:MAG TPA: DoxX family protein [Pyrinomonadaceae bacterium]|nr:DoxX family protein [Pyrinomonadaceae bacterium]
MIPKILRLQSLEKYRDFGALFLRLVVGAFLVYGTQDNVFSFARMKEFEHFLAARGVPVPLLAAFVSAYAQFVCGILFIFGAATRAAAVVMIINFVAALLIAHRGDSFQGMLAALMMLASAFFFLLHGAGKPSVDEGLGTSRRP